MRMRIFYKQTNNRLTKALQNSKYDDTYHKIGLGYKAKESLKPTELSCTKQITHHRNHSVRNSQKEQYAYEVGEVHHRKCRDTLSSYKPYNHIVDNENAKCRGKFRGSF